MPSDNAKGTISLAIASTIFMACGYITNVWLGRTLGPNDYGIYSIITTLIAIISLIQTNSITLAVAKYSAEDIKNADSVLATGMILVAISTTVFFLIFILFAEQIALLLNDIKLTEYIRLSSGILISSSIFALYSDFHNGVHNFRKQALMNMLYSTFKLFFIILLSIFYKIQGAFVAYILASVVPIIYGFRIPKKFRNIFPIKELFYFTIPIIGITIFSNLLSTIDIFLVKLLLNSKAEVGYYSASQNISKLIFYGMSAFFIVLTPRISYSVKNNLHEKTREIIWTNLRIVLLMIVPVAILISGTSKSLLELIYSKVYLQAAPSLSILIFGTSFYTIYAVFSSILTGAGKPKVPLFISIVSVICTSILGYVLIPKFGLEGAAFSTTVGCLTAVIMASFATYKYFNTLFSFRRLVKILSASSTILLLLRLLPQSPTMLPFSYFFLILVYILCLFLLKEISREDLAYCFSFIKMKVNNFADKKI